MKIDYQNNDYDFLLSFYGMKEAFPTVEAAAENGVFRALEENRPLEEIKKLLSDDDTEAELLLNILEECGLVLRGKGYICAAPVAAKYLCDGFLSEEKGRAFTAERFSAFVLALSGGLRAGKSLEALAKAVTERCADLTFETEGEADLWLTDEVTEDLPPLGEGGIIAFFGAFEGDLSLASAVEAYAKYKKKGASGLLRREDVTEFCKKQGLTATPLVSVTDGLSVIFAAKEPTALEKLTLTMEDRLIADLKKLEIRSVTKIDPKEVVASSWVKDHCRFGCSSFGDKHCPPHSPNYDETGTKLGEYKKALLIEGAPPTHSFQKLMLKAEKTAFKAGYYRAFAYWAGPCSICTECNPPLPPKKCTATRPSMESAGIDVFATVRKQGFQMETRKDKNEFVKYFGLLLLD